MKNEIVVQKSEITQTNGEKPACLTYYRYTHDP